MNALNHKFFKLILMGSLQLALAGYWPKAMAQSEAPKASDAGAAVSEPAANQSSAKASFENVDPNEEEAPKVTRPRRFVILTLGVEHDESLPPVAGAVTFHGDYKKIVSLSYAKEIKTLRFTPTHEGVAVLTVHDKTGKAVAEFRLEVKKSKLDAVMREMQSLLGDIEGISIKVVNNKIVVDGQILLPKDMNRIYNVVAQFGDQASTLVTLSPLAQKKIAEFISRDINNPEITVRAVNDKFILEGVAGSQAEKDRAEIITKTYVPAIIVEKSEMDGIVKRPKPANDGVINLITIKEEAPAPPGKMIQLVIHYVELNKDYENSFKFEFAPGIDTSSSGINFSSGSSNAGGVTSTIAGTISNFFPKLNWLKTHGHGRVLESSTLIVKDGTPGEFKSVTKYPYSVATPTGTTTQFVDIGITSNIKPTILGERSDSVELSMKFSVSSLVGTGSGGVPISSSNDVSTDIIVRSGQSAAVGGLVKNNTTTAYNRPDSATSNAIITLLASKDFTHDQSQFVVFITPVIKSSASSGSEKIKKKFRLGN